MGPRSLRLSMLVLAFYPMTYGATVAGTVNFSGNVSFIGGAPAVNALVLPVVFQAGYDPWYFFYQYGDGDGNMIGGEYDKAVADGVLTPVGDGALTGLDGSFSGSGSRPGIEGSQLYLWAYADGTNLPPHPNFSFFISLITSSDSSWIAGSSNTLTVSQATTSYFGGGSSGNTIVLDVAPFPEPSTMAMLASAGMLLLARRQPS